jgi:NADH:ubiquinone reductase (H+-translocating)
VPERSVRSIGSASDTSSKLARVVVVGAGFAGFHCLRRLEALLPREAAEIVVISPTDYMPYLPLLPEVGAGIVDPRHIAVSLTATLSRERLVPGQVVAVDLAGKTCEAEDLEGRRRTIPWDRLVLAPGSVTRTLPVPGIEEHAIGFRTIAEALYLRDHLLAQLELAAATDDPVERQARCTFVVVGAGYTGTEVAAQGQLFTEAARHHYQGISSDDLRWVLVDLAPAILPELGARLGGLALRALRRRGLDVRLRTTVEEAGEARVRLSDGTTLPACTLVWCVGVTPGPLTTTLGLETVKGRVLVDEYLTVPGHPDVFAAGDAAAVPDPSRPGGLTPMTAQHAQRHGRTVARNLAASLGYGRRRPYRHRDRGFVVDLGGWQAVANPFHVPLSGPLAKALTRGYHLLALPANRLRVATDWLNDVVEHRQFVRLGLVRSEQARLRSAEPVGRYYRSDGRPLDDRAQVDAASAAGHEAR